MKKKIIIASALLLNIFLPISIFAQEEEEAMDMHEYSKYASYCLFILFAILFSSIMFFSSKEYEKPEVILPALIITHVSTLSRELFAKLKIVHVGIIALLIINIILVFFLLW